MAKLTSLIGRVLKGAATGAIASTVLMLVAADSRGAEALFSQYGKGVLWLLCVGLGLGIGAAAGLVAPLARRSRGAAMAIGAMLGAPCVAILGLFSGYYDGYLGTAFGYAFTGALTGAVAGWIWKDTALKVGAGPPG